MVAFAAVCTVAQTTSPTPDDLRRRIDEIEAKLRALTDELRSLREQAAAGPTYQLASTPAAAVEKLAAPLPQPTVEFRRFETLYRISRGRTANHVNLALAYSF